MSQVNPVETALAKLEKLGKQAKKLRRFLGNTQSNPFESADALKKLESQLHDASDITQLSKQLSEELSNACVRVRAEFWDSFKSACVQNNWEILGTTNRRLVQQGVFVELSDVKVKVEELSLSIAPNSDAVVDLLKPHIEEIRVWRERLDDFLTALEQAFENVPGERERSLEAVYRSTFLQIQRPSFWRSLNPSQMILLTRPVFRACLSAIMSTGLMTRKGHSVRFGTSLQGKDTWELYSPGEHQVVQLSRIELI